MAQNRPAMNAGEAVAEAFRAEGVGAVYSVPGSHIHPIYDGLSRVEGLRFVTVKQEPNASLMADAYGRITGRPGVCLLTAGPGCVNSMAGVAQAYGAASPMVHLSGAVPLTADMEAFHSVDEPDFVHQMMKPITKWTARVERLEDIPETLARAFHIARSGRPGPVHVELPRLTDYSEYILSEEPAVMPEYKRRDTVVTAPDPADVDRFAQRLLDAKAPVIAVGKGVIRQGAVDGLLALAERLQAPVVYAQDTIGVIRDDHPLAACHFGGSTPHPICGMVFDRADLVFCLGTRMGTVEMTEIAGYIGDTPQIVVGFDDAPNERYDGPDRRVSDPKLFVDALLARLGNAHKPADEALLARIARMKVAAKAMLAERNAPHAGETPIHPGVLLDAMNDVFDDDTVLASDVGNCQMWTRLHRKISTPFSFMQSGVWNAMSYALPTALVAGMEMPDRTVVALAGDGAFLMTNGDLPTAAEYGANILMIVMNNGAFVQTYNQQLGLYGHTYGTEFQAPDFAMMARSCHAAGIRVDDPANVADALREGLAETKHRPALVEVMVSRSQYPTLKGLADVA
jgi:acetolactate synthase-1/2/3 large subunit